MVDERCRERILSEDYYDFLLTYVGDQIYRASEDYCLVRITESLFLAYITKDAEPELTLSSYSYQIIPKLYAPVAAEGAEIARALTAGGIPPIQGAPLQLSGRNVVLCFMDTGIDYQDPMFRYSDGSTKILSIWDQTIQGENPPEGYQYGTEYPAEMINQALTAQDPYQVVPSRDEEGHGTLLARTAIAAAPEARIVMVKLKQAKQYLRDYYLIREGALAYAETDMIQALNYLDSFAMDFARPISICIGLGTNMGDHSGSSMLDLFLDQIGARNGRSIVVAAGNEGNARHHFYGAFGQTADDSALDHYGSSQESGEFQEVEIHVGEGERGFTMELWAGRLSVLTVSVRSPGGEVIPRIPIQRGSTNNYELLYESTRIRVEYSMIEGDAGAELVFLRIENPTAGVWTLGVYKIGAASSTEDAAGMSRPEVQEPYHVWLPVTGFISEETYFLQSDPDYTLTEPSTADNVMCISAYNDLDYSIYIGSSRGYTMHDRLKPSIAAPGVNIEGVSGTCLSAAITAGAAALLLEWAVVHGNDQRIDATDVKNYFIRGARRRQEISYPNREWGYGSLDLEGTFDAMRIQ